MLKFEDSHRPAAGFPLKAEQGKRILKLDILCLLYGLGRTIYVTFMINTIPLAELNILAVDCQATGANPAKGHLLEVGWVSGRAGSLSAPERSSAQSSLIQLPEPTAIPSAVQRLTGISAAQMAEAQKEETAWQRLKTAAQASTPPDQPLPCATVIHYARFETPFLRQLHSTHDPGTAFPFQIICTHAIARRLLPDLPRKGIRAVAGYFGHCMPEFKRSADHAVATLVIWQHLTRLLQTRFGIDNLDHLARWLTQYQPPGRTKRAFPMDPAIRQGLPDKPGVYRMRPEGEEILYIGKAKSLKQRVNSYFRARAAHPEHILEMLSQAREIDFTETGSALEAAVLESDEIKHHRPPYNRALRPERRGLVFLTRDLKQHSPHCDQRFRIGPLPHGRLPDVLLAFAACFSYGLDPPVEALIRFATLALAPGADLEPAVQCLQEGFRLFLGTHPSSLQKRSVLGIVTSVGAGLWRRQLEAAAGPDAQADAETENSDDARTDRGPTAERTDWTPADIAGAIESVLKRSAYLIRRARWYCLLSESSLTWASQRYPDELKHLMVFEGGGIASGDVLPASGNLPVPPGFGRPWLERRRQLDLVAYDRMRVVTTELRRLCSQGRRIALRLGPNRCLGSSEVQKALPWV